MVRPFTEADTARRIGRAAPMAPEARRRAIVDAVVPLLIEHGDDVSTRQIAEAAGIAEGTIFRVFPDKAALLMAAAEETVNPSGGRAQLAAALEGVTSLRERVLVTTQRLDERAERVTRLMMALRRQWMSEARKPGRHDHPPGPPGFLLEADRVLHEMLTEVFEPHRAELTVEPERAARLLRTMVLGSRHPGAHREDRLTPAEITDALLDGVRRRD
jgi:AcrR family transcriptional regulator